MQIEGNTTTQTTVRLNVPDVNVWLFNQLLYDDFAYSVLRKRNKHTGVSIRKSSGSEPCPTKPQRRSHLIARYGTTTLVLMLDAKHEAMAL